MYPCSEKASKRHEVRDQVTTRLGEMEDVISQTTEYRTQQLTDIAVDIRSWIVKVKYYIFMRSILIVFPVLFYILCVLSLLYSPSFLTHYICLTLIHVKVKKWRSIYYTMSKFNVNDTRTGFIAEGWVRTSDLESVGQALKKGAVSYSSLLSSKFFILCVKFEEF